MQEVPFSTVSRPCYRSEKGPDLHAMLLECYFDDSSDPRREKYYACGGLLGDQDQWDFFEAAWSHETHGLREPFRSTDCECGHGQFSNWPKSKRDDLMARLVNIICEFRLYGFASIVPIAEFNRAFPSLDKKEAFSLAATQVIFNICHVADRNDMNADFWFEEGQQDGIILRIRDSIRALNWKPARRLRAVHFDTKRLRALQSADLIARESFKHMDNLGTRPMRIPVCKLSEILFFMLWTDGSLQHLAASGWPENLQPLLSFGDLPPDARIQHFWKRSWAFHEQTAKSIR